MNSLQRVLVLAVVSLGFVASARYHDPGSPRFLPDTQQTLMCVEPQSLNRYAYVQGNPLRYVDPDGHDPAEISPRTYAVIAAEKRAENVGIFSSKDMGKALGKLDQRYRAGDALEPVDPAPYLKANGGVFSVDPDLAGPFAVILEVPDVKVAVENTQSLGPSVVLRTPSWLETIGPRAKWSWARTSYDGTTLETVMFSELIERSNSGRLIGGQPKTWISTHSTAEELAHEIGHTEGAAILTEGKAANVPKGDIAQQKLFNKTNANARALGESVRSAYGLDPSEHSEAQAHTESGSRADSQAELKKEAAAKAMERAKEAADQQGKSE